MALLLLFLQGLISKETMRLFGNNTRNSSIYGESYQEKKGILMLLKFDVFGKTMLVERKQNCWLLFVDSGRGMRTRVFDVVIPPELAQADLAVYLDDIFHEHSSERHPNVTSIDK